MLKLISVFALCIFCIALALSVVIMQTSFVEGSVKWEPCGEGVVVLGHRTTPSGQTQFVCAKQ